MDDKQKFAADIALSKFSLDDASEKQSSLYNYWADLLAEAKSEKAAAYDELKTVKAQKVLFYRKNPLNGDKVTEGSIEAMVDADLEMIHTKTVLRQKTREVDELEGRVRAFEHKKEAITNLRHLYIQGYWSTPAGRSRTDDMTDEMRDQLNEKRQTGDNT